MTTAVTEMSTTGMKRAVFALEPVDRRPETQEFLEALKLTLAARQARRDC